MTILREAGNVKNVVWKGNKFTNLLLQKNKVGCTIEDLQILSNGFQGLCDNCQEGVIKPEGRGTIWNNSQKEEGQHLTFYFQEEGLYLLSLWTSCLTNNDTDFMLGTIWYEQNMIYMWSKYNKELAIISNKAIDNPGYMIF